jgi:hypothetical protein
MVLLRYVVTLFKIRYIQNHDLSLHLDTTPELWRALQNLDFWGKIATNQAISTVSRRML